MEKRKFERVQFCQPVVVVDEVGQSFLGDACDLSIGGMFIAGVTAPFGTRLVVHIHALADDWTIAVPSVVRWSRENGVGVQFGSLGARETHAITTAIGRAAPSRSRQRSVPAAEIEIELDDVADSSR